MGAAAGGVAGAVSGGAAGAVVGTGAGAGAAAAGGVGAGVVMSGCVAGMVDGPGTAAGGGGVVLSVAPGLICTATSPISGSRPPVAAGSMRTMMLHSWRSFAP